MSGKKRLLSLLLVVALLISQFATVSVSAQSDELYPDGEVVMEEDWEEETPSDLIDSEDGVYQYRVTENGTAEITGYYGEEAELEIPQEIDTYTVEIIGDYAFYDCFSLESVTIPNSVESIGRYAFGYCELENVTIPDGIKSIGDYAFSCCYSLESVTIGNSVTSIGEEAFSNCSSLESVTIGNSVESIGSFAFSSCSSLKSITFPKSVSYIGYRALTCCSSLKEIIVEEGNEYYLAEDNVLYDTEKSTLHMYAAAKEDTTFELPSSVVYIISSALTDCIYLQEITVAEGNSTYYAEDGVVFSKNGDGNDVLIAYPAGKTEARYDIPETVSSIYFRAFSSCKNLKEISIGNRYPLYDLLCECFDEDNYISDVYFDGTKAEWEESFVNINAYALRYSTIHCTDGDLDQTFRYEINEEGTITITEANPNLEALEIPEEIDGLPVTHINDGAFEYNKTLRSITLPSSITIIGNSAFYGCYSLDEVIFHGTKEQFENIQIHGENDALLACTPTCSDGVLERPFEFDYTYTEDGTIRIYGVKNAHRNLVIPEEYDGYTVTEIDAWAFEWQSYIKTVTIPKTVKYIGYGAFRGCNSLQEIVINPENQWLTFHDGVIYNKDKTTYLSYIFGDNSDMYVIPEGVTTIGSYAFYGNYDAFSAISLPSTLTLIENYAFYDCYFIEEVEFNGTVEEFGKIEIGDQNDALTRNLIKCSDGDYEVPLSFSYGVYGEGGHVEIYGVSNVKEDGIVEIPETLGGYPVTQIAEFAFDNNSDIKSVRIPKTIEHIGEGAFNACYSLKEITVDPQSQWFTSQDGVLYNKDMTKLIAYPGAKENSSFEIPETVTEIFDYAFKYCDNLQQVTFPTGLTKINSYAFSCCYGLTDISLPNSVAYIGADTFCGCENLVDISLPEGITYIGPNAFTETAYYFDQDNWDNGALYIDEYLIRVSDNVDAFEIKDGTTLIANNAFFDSDIQSLSIPASVKYINNYAFEECLSLETVYFDGTAEKFKEIIVGTGNSCLFDCTIQCRDGIAEAPVIFNYDFDEENEGGINIYDIENPKENLVIPAEIDGYPVTSISGLVIYGEDAADVKTVTIPSTVKDIFPYAFGDCDNIEAYIVDGAKGNFTAVDGVLFNADKTELVFYPVNKAGESYTVPNGVNKIGDNAFYGNRNLVSVTLADSVTTIHPSGFDSSKRLTEVTFSKNLTRICTDAFFDCLKLTDVFYGGNDEDKTRQIEIEEGNELLLNATWHYNSYVCQHKEYTSVITTPATCTKEGVKTFTCVNCGETKKETIKVVPHKLTDLKAVAATYEKTGLTAGKKCSVCNTVTVKQTVTAKLPQTSLKKAKFTLKAKTYTGKAIKQSFKVKLGSKTLTAGVDYTVSYKNNKNIGKATVTIKGIGAYKDSVSKTFAINPKKVSSLKVKAGKKQLTVSWKKDSKVGGYEIVYATSKNFKSGKKTVKVTKASTAKKVISKLKAKKTYYVKVRAFKKVSGKTYYGAYTSVKKIKVK